MSIIMNAGINADSIAAVVLIAEGAIELMPRARDRAPALQQWILRVSMASALLVLVVTIAIGVVCAAIGMWPPIVRIGQLFLTF